LIDVKGKGKMQMYFVNLKWHVRNDS
jgi:hypothetical protein